MYSAKQLSLVIALLSMLLCSACVSDQQHVQEATAAFNSGRYDEAFKLNNALADSFIYQDDEDVLYRMGYMYLHGLGVSRNLSKAEKYLYAAHGKGSVSARYELGNLYMEKKSFPQAAQWYAMASRMGNAAASRKLAILYLNGRKQVIKGNPDEWADASMKEALSLLTLAAKRGDMPGATLLADMYREGRGVEKDEATAATWYKVAATNGDPDAQYRMGVMYEEGTVIQQDLAEAAKWYQKAADQDQPSANYKLGVCYDLGLGLGQNSDLAEEYYARAADLGAPLALLKKANMTAQANQGNAAQQRRATSLYRRAAQTGNAEAQCALGKRYLKGDGTQTNLWQAQDWLHKAAAQGNDEAKKLLAENEQLFAQYAELTAAWEKQKAAFERVLDKRYEQLEDQWYQRCRNVLSSFFKIDHGPGEHVCTDCERCEQDKERALNQFNRNRGKEIAAWESQHPRPTDVPTTDRADEKNDTDPAAESKLAARVIKTPYLWRQEELNYSDESPLYNELYFYPEGYYLILSWRRNPISGEEENGHIKNGAWKIIGNHLRLQLRQSNTAYGDYGLVDLTFDVGSDSLTLQTVRQLFVKDSPMGSSGDIQEVTPIVKKNWQASDGVGRTLFADRLNSYTAQGIPVGSMTRYDLDFAAARQRATKPTKWKDGQSIQPWVTF